MKLFVLFLFVAVAFAAEPIPLGPTPAVPAENSNIEVLQVYSVSNPEEVAVDPSETFFITGGADGYLYKVYLDTGDTEEILSPRDFFEDSFTGMTDEEVKTFCTDALSNENTCGRILGIRYDQWNPYKIYLVNAYSGIYELKLKWNGKVKYLKHLVSIFGGLVNDLVQVDHELYYTVTHDFKQRSQLSIVVLDSSAPRGSLNVYNMRTKRTCTLVRDIFFSNGVTLSSDKRYLYVSETMAARIRKYDLQERAEAGFLIEDLPIYTDNIYLKTTNKYNPWCRRCNNNDGTLIVPGYWRNADLDNLLRNPSDLYDFLEQDPSVYVPLFVSYINSWSVLLQVDEATGTIAKQTFDNSGSAFLYASSCHPLANDEFICGSVFVPFATRFRLLD